MTETPKGRLAPDLEVGDLLTLRKPHPCGGSEWQVFRLGADIGIRCTTCAHRILLARAVLLRRIKRVVRASQSSAVPDSAHPVASD